MICFLSPPLPAEFKPGNAEFIVTAEEPRAVGQFMAAVLERYGISTDTEAATSASGARSASKGIGAGIRR